MDCFKSNNWEVTYTYTSNERRVDIHDRVVRMSAVAAKEAKSRPSDRWKPEQSQRFPGVSGAGSARLWQPDKRGGMQDGAVAWYLRERPSSTLS